MPELESRTARIRRGWLDRLRGFDRLYETRVTDGHHVVAGRGATRRASEHAAQKTWETTVRQPTEMTGRELPSSAPSIAPGRLHEVIDALRADNGRLLRLLIKRLANDGQPRDKELTQLLVRHPKLRDLVEP